MPLPVRFDIQFNFDRLNGKQFSFVCCHNEYGKLCERLGGRFEQYEKTLLEDDFDGNGLLPDERFYHSLTSASSFRKFTGRQSRDGITIKISRASDRSWIFDVEDLDGKMHRFSNMLPGEYNATVLFKSIGAQYVFTQRRRKKIPPTRELSTGGQGADTD